MALQQQVGGVRVECKETVQVRIEIARREETALIEGVTVNALLPAQLPYAFSIEPPEVNLRIKGPTILDDGTPLSGIGPDNLKGIVDLRSLAEPGAYNLPLEVVLPPGVRVDQKPGSVVVELRPLLEGPE